MAERPSLEIPAPPPFFPRPPTAVKKSSGCRAKGQRSHCKRAAITLPKGSDHIAKGLRLPCKKPAATFLAAHGEQRACSGCRAKSQQPHSWQLMKNNGNAAVAGQKAGNHIAKACKANCVRSVHGSIAMVHCALPPWRLVLLEGRVASAASYPAWPMTEKARPKVLVFLRLWWMLLGIKGEPSELPIGFEACGGTSCKGDRMAMVAVGCRRMAGNQARMTESEAFLRVLKPAASPLRNPRSCRRMTGGDVPAIHLSTLEGASTVITAVFGRPFQGQFPLGLLSPGHSASQR